MNVSNTNTILTIIKVFLGISFCAFFTTFYGLQNEKKIELIYDEIESLRSANVDLNDWSLTFSGNLTDLSSSILVTKQKYELEKDDLKYCLRILIIGKGFSLYEWFFDTYANSLTEDQDRRYKIADKIEAFNVYNQKDDEKKLTFDVCDGDENVLTREYVITKFPGMVDWQSDFLFLIQDLRSANFSREQELYKEISMISDRSAKIYLISFFVQLGLSLMIIFLDLYTNRGIREK